MPKVMPIKYDPEKVLQSDIPYLIEQIRKREEPSYILRLLLLALFPEDTFDMPDYDALAEELAEYLCEVESDRKDAHGALVAKGKIPASSEERLDAFVSIYLHDSDAEREHAESMKTMAYQDFLETDYWKVVRGAVVARHGARCQLCSKHGPLHVHHRTYEHRGYEHRHLEDLICLCSKCHAKFHDKLADTEVESHA